MVDAYVDCKLSVRYSLALHTFAEWLPRQGHVGVIATALMPTPASQRVAPGHMTVCKHLPICRVSMGTG